ncbi:MAG: glycosyltransferase family 9 protein [Myxococcota bacterium]|nr:glycosyltransferase family 9 protein [Myxococcota bacterium]
MTRLVQVAVPNHLGDAVMALPEIRRLATALPGAVLRLVGRPLPARVLDGQGPWEPVSQSWSADREAAAVLLGPSFRVALAAWRAGASVRVGTPTDWRRFLLTHPVDASIAFHHQQEIYRRVIDQAVACLGGDPCGEAPSGFQVDPAGEAWWRSVGCPPVVLHPWAAGNPSKRWPVERWLALGEALGLVAVTGGPSGEDARKARVLAERLGASCAAGETALSPRAWAGLARVAPQVVLPDTGLAHLAAAVGASPIVLFGPTDPERYAPPGARVVRGPSMDCISVDAVLEAVHGN